MSKTICASIQMVSGPNMGANLAEAGRLIGKAVGEGAALIVLPENFALVGISEFDILEHAELEGAGPIQDFLASTAKSHKIWIVGGTVPMAASSGKVRVACLIYDDQGCRVARYDKIHLFDVDVPGVTEHYRESRTIEPGGSPVVLDTLFGTLGVAICYDLRFPELFRRMVDLGMEILAVPAAFTARTGVAHWEVLIRARAVENLCYVIASNQGGLHVSGRETFGHSMIVDPWGSVLASLPTGGGVVCAEVDKRYLAQVRASFPALNHRRLRCT